MDTRIVSQEVQDKVLGQVRKGQETMAGALRAAAAAAQSVTPPSPALPPALASRLPSRDELVSSAHDLAGQLLTVQRKASELLDTQRVTGDLQTIQRKASEFLDGQRKLADRAIEAVSPLLALAGITTARPADAPAGLPGQGAPTAAAAPASTSKASAATSSGPRKKAVTKSGAKAPATKAPATKVRTARPAAAKKAGSGKQAGAAKKPGTAKK